MGSPNRSEDDNAAREVTRKLFLNRDFDLKSLSRWPLKALKDILANFALMRYRENERKKMRENQEMKETMDVNMDPRIDSPSGLDKLCSAGNNRKLCS